MVYYVIGFIILYIAGMGLIWYLGYSVGYSRGQDDVYRDSLTWLKRIDEKNGMN